MDPVLYDIADPGPFGDFTARPDSALDIWFDGSEWAYLVGAACAGDLQVTELLDVYINGAYSTTWASGLGVITGQLPLQLPGPGWFSISIVIHKNNRVPQYGAISKVGVCWPGAAPAPALVPIWSMRYGPVEIP